MLAQVYEKLPGLYRWVEYCYSDSAYLFFGTCLLLSAAGVQQGDPLGPLLFSLVLHPLALKIQKEFPNLLLNVWYLDDGCIVGDVNEVYEVFQLLQVEGPARGLHLNVKKNEIWWPSRSSSDPFPAEVDRVTNEGVKLLGVPIGTKEFTSQFVKKKLKVLKDVCDLLKEVDNAQVELGLFRGCLSFNKINHLLRTSPPDLLEEALSQFDEHFHAMLATILRVPCLAEDQWEQASLPVKYAGIGVNQTKIVAGPAYIGSCVLTRDLVAALLKRKHYNPPGVAELQAEHEAATSIPHDLVDLQTQQRVQQQLSAERHEAIFQELMARSSARSNNLMLACSMPHASDWLLAPPIPGLGLALQSDKFRTALKFRLGIPLFSPGSTCPALSHDGKVCGAEMDDFGDHAVCCHFGTSLVFRHNNARDIMAHAAKAAGLSVVVERKHQVEGSGEKPGDLTIQQYHRGYASSAFDITVTHPLQKKYNEVAMEEAGVAAQDAHDRKLQKSLAVCTKEGLHFVPLSWESLGGATETVHETVCKWTELESARGGYPTALIRRNLYSQLSCCLARHLAQAVIDRQPELGSDHAL